jgi:ribosome-associated protein
MSPQLPPIDDQLDPLAPVSKTQRKREMHELQDIGEQLVGLPLVRLRELALPEPLLDAVMAARNISKFGALRRQMQYIGRLMRTVDIDPLRFQLDAWNGKSAEHTAWLHRVELWRDRLIDDEAALGQFIALHAGADAQHLRSLIRSAIQEKIEGRPPRAYRALFQLVRGIVPAPEKIRGET